jgi:hypothetical protein
MLLLNNDDVKQVLTMEITMNALDQASRRVSSRYASSSALTVISMVRTCFTSSLFSKSISYPNPGRPPVAPTLFCVLCGYALFQTRALRRKGAIDKAALVQLAHNAIVDDIFNSEVADFWISGL